MLRDVLGVCRATLRGGVPRGDGLGSDGAGWVIGVGREVASRLLNHRGAISAADRAALAAPDG